MLAAAPVPRQPSPAPAAVASLSAAASAASPPPTTGSTLGDTANAQAFHNVAVKVAQDHPDLLADPAWDTLAAYVQPFV